MADTSPSAGSSDSVGTTSLKQWLDVFPAPKAKAGSAKPHGFVSHAGELKYKLVDHLRVRFNEQHPALQIFVDEWSLHAGEEGLQRIADACWGASVGVLILSKEFVRKKHCMAELRILLRRWKDAQAAASDASQQAGNDTPPAPTQPVQLLPVLYNLSFEQLEGMRALYDSEEWCVEDDKPPEAVLDEWASDLSELLTLNVIRPDQWRGDAQLVDLIVKRAVEQLEEAGQLPPLAAAVKPMLAVVKCAASPSKVALVGREQQLEKGLHALHQQRYVEIRGAPGEGKSTLAQHLVAAVCQQWENLSQEEAGGQVAYALEVNMAGLQESAGGVEAAVAMHLLSAVGAVITAQQVAQGSLWSSLLGWLGRQACTVIVFENTEAVLLNESTAEALQPMIKQLLSVQRAGVRCVHMVVATRAGVPSVEGIDEEASVIMLGRLSEDEGMQLLKAHLPESKHVWGPDEERAARQLVQLAECNPLALSVAAGLVKAKDLKWQDLVDKQKLADLRPKAKHKPGGMGRQIQQLREWLGSFLDKVDRQCLAGMTVFPGSFTVGGAAAVTGSNDAETLLESLAWASLLWHRTVSGISSHGTSQMQEEKRYSLHALVREAAKALHVDSSKDKLVRSLADWMLLEAQGPGQVLLRVEPKGAAPDMLMCWYVLREEVVNLSAAADGLGVAVEGEECSGNLPLLYAAGDVGYQLSRSGLGSAAQRLHEAAAVLSEKVLGAEHPDTLISKDNLACTLRAIGALGEARQLEEEVLEVRTRVLGAEHPDTLTSMSNLASTLSAMAELGAARRLEEKVLVVRTRLLGAEHPDTLTSMNNLASTLQDMGELGEARQLEEAVLEVRIRVLGAEHPGTLTSMNNLASTLRATGELGKARQLQEHVLEVCTRVLGAEHPDTLSSMNNLALTLRDMGDLGEARRLQEAVLEVRTRVQGAEHPDTLTSMSNLASTLRARGELGNARQLQEEVLEVCTRVLGAEHPKTLTSMNNLAGTLQARGELGKARQLQEAELQVCTRVLGKEHPKTLTSMNNLASTLWAMGELGAARQQEEEVLEVRTRVLGAEHPDTLTSRNNLASTLWAMGELGAARQQEEEVLEVRTKVLGAEHPDTLTSMSNLASTLWAMGELGEARQLAETVLEVRTRVQGAEHPDTLTSMNNLASTLRAMGELEQARKTQEEVLEVRTRVLGAEHPDTLTTMNNLAITLRTMGELREARQLQEEQHRVCKRVLGAQHPHTLSSENNLAIILQAMGELEEAPAPGNSS